MRKILFLLAAAGLIAAVAYYYRRPIVLSVDGFYTIQTSARSFETVSYEGDGNGGILHFGDETVSLNEMAEGVARPRVGTTKQGELALTVSGQVFAFGPPTDAEALTARVPSGDQTRLEIRRSAVSWPNPFEVNWMSGHSPSWKRFVYRHLTWKKADQSQLEMLWRYEQFYYSSDGWTDAWMTNPGSTGLIHVQILRASR